MKAQAGTAVFNVKNAIEASSPDYRRYPVPSEETMEEGYLTDEMIMNVLVSGPTELNPRQIVFFSGRKAQPMEGDDSGKFENGLSVENGNTKLWDPWGNLYRLSIDLNDDGKVKGPEGIDTQNSIAVWSPGPDGEDGTPNDVRSW